MSKGRPEMTLYFKAARTLPPRGISTPSRLSLILTFWLRVPPLSNVTLYAVSPDPHTILTTRYFSAYPLLPPQKVTSLVDSPSSSAAVVEGDPSSPISCLTTIVI